MIDIEKIKIYLVLIKKIKIWNKSESTRIHLLSYFHLIYLLWCDKRTWTAQLHHLGSKICSWLKETHGCLASNPLPWLFINHKQGKGPIPFWDSIPLPHNLAIGTWKEEGMLHYPCPFRFSTALSTQLWWYQTILPSLWAS